ncbi:MAG TPA: TetR/AcrR family transcriptional regulator [Myxococcota bacterium]
MAPPTKSPRTSRSASPPKTSSGAASSTRKTPSRPAKKTASKKATTTTTTRTTKRPTLRDAQRQLTRTRILEAGAQRFAAPGYGATTVDDIVSAAGIGRATFYLHFKSQQEVMEALLEEVLPTVSGLYDDLMALPVIDLDALTGWLQRFFAFYAGHKGVLSASMQAETIDSAWTKRIEAVSWKFVARFAGGTTAATKKELRQVRALILLEELDRIAYLIEVRGWKVDRTAAIAVLAEHWLDFFMEPPRPAAR